MAVVAAQRSLAEILRLGPFDGGLNLRDAYTEIAPNELADGTNFTLDERGVATKRFNCPNSSSAFATVPGAVTAFFWSTALQLFILQSGVTLYKCPLGGGAWTAFRTCSNSSVVAMCDFAGKLVYVHPADGVRTYDGTTDAVGNATVTGSAIAVWQNKCWVTGIGVRVSWSALGDPATWATATDWVDVREKDNKTCLALLPAAGGLLAFKEDSTVRINDSTTGAFTTIDWTTGTVGARSVTSQDGRVVTWALDGLYVGNGLGPFRNVGDKLRPRFQSAPVNGTTKPMISAVGVYGRIYFAFPRTSTTITDAILEYNPRVGWLMEHYFAGAQIGPFTKCPSLAGLTIAAFASGAATIKDLFTDTTRTGFACSLATGYLEPYGGKLSRILRLRPELTMPGANPITLGLNYTDASGVPQVLTLPAWTATSAGTQRPNFWPSSVGRAFQIFLNDTATPLNSLSVLQASIDAIPLER